MSAVFQLGPAGYADSIEAALRRRVVLPSEFYGQLAGQARNAAFSVSRLAGIEQIQTVLESLVDDLKAGGDFEAWRRRVLSTPGLGQLTPAHLENIYRTNLQVWHSAGRARSILDNRSTHPFLQYSAILDTRTRPSHARLHGTILPVDHEFWSRNFPPLGFQCRCQVIALTRRQAERRIREAEAAGRRIDAPPGEGADPGWDYDRLNGTPLDSQRAALERRAVSLGEVQPAIELRERKTAAEALEQAIQEAAADVVRQGVARGDGTEFATILDSAGRVMQTKQGGRHYVNFSAAEVERAIGGTVVHNHPSGVGLSPQDLALSTRGLQIIAAGHPTTVGGVTVSAIYRATALTADPSVINARWRWFSGRVEALFWRAIEEDPARRADAFFWQIHATAYALAARRTIRYETSGLPPIPDWVAAAIRELLLP